MKTQGLYKGERFSTDISVSVAQIEKFQKARWLYFLILLLGGPSPPSQLVPNPFNWSPNNVFYRYLCIGRSNRKISKSKVVLFFNFASGRTLPTQSTGPHPHINFPPRCCASPPSLLATEHFVMNHFNYNGADHVKYKSKYKFEGILYL